MDELIANASPEDLRAGAALSGILLLGGCIAILLLVHYLRRNRIEPAELTRRLSGASWSTPQVGLVVAVLLLCYLLASFCGLFFYEEQIPAARLLITVGIYTLISLMIFVISARHGSVLGPVRPLLFAPLLYLAIIPGLMLAAKGWHLTLEHLFGLEVELQEVAQVLTQDLSPLQIGYMLTAILLAPFYEELLFRGVLFPFLVRLTGWVPGMLIVSGLFAAMHNHLPSILPLFLLSCALCLTRWRMQSVWPCIGIHILFNTVSILALNLIG